ncbi:hypothetical protein [Janibacter terrae]|uniref:hypothetical protein n=1 Tax=Janibacter terrae TaxID=103817 RepID=UPI000AFBE479|nr:hypothetical protein [Janibacter terrae]
MPTISELIERQRRDSGLSYREMAERAARAGLHIKFQTIANLATTPPKEWPKRAETIRALAEGLDVPERLVVLAFACSFGLDVQRDESTLGLMLPAGTRHLDEGVQRAVAAMVRSIVDAREDVGNDDRSAATTQAPGSGVPTKDQLAELRARQEDADGESVEHITRQAADRDEGEG